MSVANESTISDLKLAISQLETEKRRINEQLRALVTSLRYFEDPKGESGISVGEQQRDDDLEEEDSVPW